VPDDHHAARPAPIVPTARPTPRRRQPAPAKEVGAILATAIGPVVAASLVAATGSWWPIAAMLVVYSLITLVSAALAPEVRGRDLVRLEDAA
jgi:MFS transporter, MHS family, metabolite:H+ symporter